MMKKILCTLGLVSVVFSLSAAFVPFSYNRTSSFFSSPATIGEVEEDTPFGFMVDVSSDIKGLSFLSSPLSVTEEAAESLALSLEKKDMEWWKDNAEVISVFSSFDSSFPVPSFDEDNETFEL